MLQCFQYRFILILLMGLTGSFYANAQDSSEVIKIIRSGRLNFIKKDSLELTRVYSDTINGAHVQALFQHGTTLLYADSAIKRTDAVDAYGNVHINNNDSVHTYSDFLHYNGPTRVATLRGNARLTDKQVVISGPEMVYDMNAKIGSYSNGGKLVNEKSTLTSHEAFYYTETKDVYFKKNVVLINPDYTLSTDTLLYNTDTKIATIVAPTTINDGKRITYVSSGIYNTETGMGNFTSRPIITDSTGDFTADNIDIDKLSGVATATGNMIWRDTVHKIILLGNYGQINQTNKFVFATQRPVSITYSGKDTLFMTGDTLASGIIKKDTAKVYAKDSIIAIQAPAISDSLETAPDSAASEFRKRADLAIAGRRDSATITVQPSRPDSIPKIADANRDSLRARIALSGLKPDSIAPTVPIRGLQPDSLAARPLAMVTDSVPPKDTTEHRYINAYHNVRIYSDSLQAVCDSAYYSSVDSVFRMYQKPVLWVKEMQMFGDTVFLFTKNKKGDKILLDQNAMLATEVIKGYYNQIKGNTITGYFKDDKLYYMRVYGNAESLVYQQDADSAFTNVQRSTCAIIDMHFVDGQLEYIVNIKDHEGGIYPFTQFPADQRLLTNFKWEFDRKPKSRYELIGN